MNEINKHLKPGEEVFTDNNGLRWRVWVSIEDYKIPSEAKDGDILGYSNCSCQHVHPVIVREKNGKLIKTTSTGYY